jgi:hypothetical protein
LSNSIKINVKVFLKCEISHFYFYLYTIKLKEIEIMTESERLLNNNGWTKIETKEDLPEHWGEYDVVIRGKIGRATYLRNDMWLVDGNDYPKKTSDHCITHYEQKIKRELPLY